MFFHCHKVFLHLNLVLDFRVALTPEQADTMWQGMASDLSSLLQGHSGEIPDSAVPFDAASDVTMEQQRYVTV
jgi:hypothetical protein